MLPARKLRDAQPRPARDPGTTREGFRIAASAQDAAESPAAHEENTTPVSAMIDLSPGDV